MKFLHAFIILVVFIMFFSFIYSKFDKKISIIKSKLLISEINLENENVLSKQLKKKF